jgi:Tol biopolymer transport system component
LGFLHGAAYDPKLSWHSIRTEHFSIDFPSESLSAADVRLARDFAQAAEQAYARVAPLMKWQPRERIDVVIQDFYDYANGSSAPFPSNVITAIPTFPSADRFATGNWFRELLIHEFTHTEDMDMVAGLPRLLRWGFGRFSVPNAFLPVWGLEGLAVYTETELSDFGRDRSAYYDMQWRMAATESRFGAIDQATTYNLGRFPWGEAPYLFGGGFHKYLAARYGREKVVKLHQVSSGQIPFFSNAAARRVFGRPLTELWSDWQRDAEERAWSQVLTVRAQPLTRFRRLTTSGEYWQSPVFSADDRHIYCLRHDQSSLPALVSISLGTGEQEVIRSDFINPDLRLTPDGAKLVFSKPDLLNDHYEFDDLYELDLVTAELRRTTTGMRAREPSVLARDKSMLFVANSKGQTNIRKLDSLQSLTDVTSSTDYTQYSFPALSPDGRLLLTQVSRPGTGSDIALFDLVSGWQFALTSDRATDLQPRWSPDGNHVVFSSDRTGVFNIYAYSLKDRELFQVTNVMGGAFAPAVSHDGRQLAFVSYSSGGYDIAVTDFDPKAWQEARLFIDTLPRHEYAACSSLSPVTRYDPWPSLRPKSWLPIAQAADGSLCPGLLTLGADALYHHQYTAQVGYDLGIRSPFGLLSYTNDQFLPTLGVAAAADLRSQSADVSATFVRRRLLSKGSLTGDCSFSRTPARTLVGATLSGVFSNALAFGYSISPAQGQAIAAFVSAYPKFTFSAGNLIRAGASWQGFAPLVWRNHVLTARAALGAGFGDGLLSRSFYGGGTQGALKLRGFDVDPAPSSRVLSSGIEYRFPLFRIERGPGLFPLFLHVLSGAAFVEAGSSWSTGGLPGISAIRGDAGVEFSLTTTVGYLLPVSFQVGVARGFRAADDFKVYFNVGSSLLEELLSRNRRPGRLGFPDLLQQPGYLRR